MATDPEASARHKKTFAYIYRRMEAAAAPALSDLAASSPAVQTAFERAGLLAPCAAPAQRAPRPAPAPETAGAPWDLSSPRSRRKSGLIMGAPHSRMPPRASCRIRHAPTRRRGSRSSPRSLARPGSTAAPCWPPPRRVLCRIPHAQAHRLGNRSSPSFATRPAYPTPREAARNENDAEKSLRASGAVQYR